MCILYPPRDIRQILHLNLLGSVPKTVLFMETKCLVAKGLHVIQ